MPRRALPKTAAALCLALILAGCGGHAATQQAQTVTGRDFRFQAPVGWKVTRAAGTATASRGSTMLRVETFNLLKPYRHALLPQVTRELDGDAAKLAAGLRARIAARGTIAIAGHDARMYTLAYGNERQQITFVLDGAREYELICKFDSPKAEPACAQLVSTFALT